MLLAGIKKAKRGPKPEWIDGRYKVKKKMQKWIFLLIIIAVIGIAAFTGTSAVMAISNTGNTGGFSLAGLLTSYRMFYGVGEVIGENGTVYSGNIINASGAVVDTSSSPGYFSTGEQEDYNVKYAVCIYGIKHDTYKVDGQEETAGLTFGPALGANYVSGHVSHITEEEFLSGKSGVCLHWMTWEEIAIQSAADPEAFEECLENGCTHAVEITLNDTITGSSYKGKMDQGDGAGVLYNSILRDYRAYNNAADNVWSSSRLRATLNGADSLTDSSMAGTDTLDSSECLFSCIQEDLRSLIVQKEVKTSTVRYSTEESDVETTYDYIWLFSLKEIFSYSGNFALKYEGEQYAKLQLAGLSDYQQSYSMLEVFNENGTHYQWLLRSQWPSWDDHGVVRVNTSGSTGFINDVTNKGTGICFGFCIP